MAQYTIQFYPTIAQIIALRADAEMSDFLDMAEDFGAKSSYKVNGAGTIPIRILPGAYAEVADAGIDLTPAINYCLDNGIITILTGGVWVTALTASLLNDVPANWPHATSTELVDDVEVVTPNTYRDVCQIVDGDSGVSLVRCALHCKSASNCLDSEADTPEMVSLFKAQFPTSSLYYLESRAAWVAANTTPAA